MKVLVTCGVFEPGRRAGGPVRSVAHIVGTASEHVEIDLVAGDRDLGDSRPYPGLSGRRVRRGRARVHYLNTRSARQWLRLWRDLRSTRFDVLYLNSLWSPAFTMLPVLAVRLGLLHAHTVLLAPRGAFAPAALARRARKKRLCWRWWGRVLAATGVVWHAATDREAADIRAHCPGARVEVNANQIALEPAPLPPEPGAEVLRLVFVGRICPVKNLHLTLTALRGLRGRAVFDVYGPIEDAAYWARCRALAAALPAGVRVAYGGELAPARIRQTFAGYDAFVFPTLGESLGHVVAESLSASCPVVCSDRTPWTAVLAAGGGLVLRELTAATLGAALSRLAALSPAQRLRLRRAAGDAYLAWRGRAGGPTILDQLGAAPTVPAPAS